MKKLKECLMREPDLGVVFILFPNGKTTFLKNECIDNEKIWRQNTMTILTTVKLLKGNSIESKDCTGQSFISLKCGDEKIIVLGGKSLSLERLKKIAQHILDLEIEDNLYLKMQHVFDKHLSVNISFEEMVEELHVTKAQLREIVKTNGHKTYRSFATNYKIGKAKNMLKNPEFAIHEISAKLGYNDSSAFYKLFKAQTGSSPTDYRKAI